MKNKEMGEKRSLKRKEEYGKDNRSMRKKEGNMERKDVFLISQELKFIACELNVSWDTDK